MNDLKLTREIIPHSVPFTDIQDLSPLIEKIKDKKVIMLGESTHGTREFYEWRSQLTRELIQRYGYQFIAVEGDWPPCQEVNRFIQNKNQMGSFDSLKAFSRWPTWLWANAETLYLMDWLKEWNDDKKTKVGFHGLDIYSLFESIDEVIRQFKDIDAKFSKKLKKYYCCFDPYWKNERAYARSLFHSPKGCKQMVTEAYEEVMKRFHHGPEVLFDATQNARVIKNAEKYYSSMTLNDNSWNIRDHHMMETLNMLMEHYGPDAKGIVWEHNTHIGDYRATDMAAYGQVNLGGLARMAYGNDQVALIGFTTYNGHVLASPSWDGPIEVMPLIKAKAFSLEACLHNSIPYVGHDNYYLMLDELKNGSPLLEPIDHRAVGVIYHPEHELKSNYVPSVIGQRYDALIFLDKTKALTPLHLDFDKNLIPQTFPFGSRI
jgi:erythromycin esterase